MNYSGAASSRLGGGGSRSRDSGRDGKGSGSNSDLADLVHYSSYGKNWRGVVIALLVIAAICSLIGLSIFLVTPGFETVVPREALTLNDLFDVKTQPHHVVVQWLHDGDTTMMYINRNGDLIELNAENNRTTVVMNNETIMNTDADRWLVSPDGRYVLLATNVNQLNGLEQSATYVIYDRQQTNSDQFVPFPSSTFILSQSSSPKSDQPVAGRIQHVEWSPSPANALTFVYENNIYFQLSPSSEKVHQLTFNGRPGLVYCGIADWFYTDEILRNKKTYWFAPDGRHLAYICINVTNVPPYRFPVYGSADTVYSTVQDMHYPKAGDDRPGILPVATVYVVDLHAPTRVHLIVEPPSALLNQEHYVTTVQWRDDGQLLISWSNRRQNTTWFTLCHVTSTSFDGSSSSAAARAADRTAALPSENCRTIWKETVDGKGWLLVKNLVFVDNGRSFLTLLSSNEGTSGSWKHIASLSISKDNTSAVKTFITRGRLEVTDIVGYSAESSTVFYIATDGDPRRRHLYSAHLQHRVSDGDNSATKKPFDHRRCMSCSQNANTCQYVSAQFSPSSKYYVIGCLGPEVPSYRLHAWSAHRNHSSDAFFLEDNSGLQALLSKRSLSRKEYIRVPTADGRESLWAQILLPPGLNQAHITRYPLLIHTHAEPGTQLVTERFSIDWLTYMSSSQHVIVASVDGRGSGGRGDKFLNEIHRRPGSLEVDDQLTAARFLNATFPFIDEDNIAICGSSYGGFVTLHALANSGHGSPFTCAVAVSPVTDWKYYDVAFAERLLGSPASTDNYRGYDDANVSSKAPEFKGKELMLIHSTSDEKVHYQHSAHLQRALTDASVVYHVRVYSDVPHDALFQQLPPMTSSISGSGLHGGSWNGEMTDTLTAHVSQCKKKVALFCEACLRQIGALYKAICKVHSPVGILEEELHKTC